MKKITTLLLSVATAGVVHLNAQIVTRINPGAVHKGQTLDLSITGQNTTFMQGTAALNFIGAATEITVNSLQAISNTEYRANVTIAPGAAAGMKIFTVEHSEDGIIHAEVPLIVHPDADEPRVVSLSHYRAAPGQTLDLVITGANTTFDAASQLWKAHFSNANANFVGSQYVMMSATQISTSITIPNDLLYKGNFVLNLIDELSGKTITSGAYFSVFSVGVEDEVLSEKSFTVYPVPASDVINIRTERLIRELSLFNNLGQEYTLHPQQVKQEAGTYQVSLAGNGLAPGLYYMRLTTDDGIAYKELMIK